MKLVCGIEPPHPITCANAACWCRKWPPQRWSMDGAEHYTYQELPSEGTTRVFRHVIIERTTA